MSLSKKCLCSLTLLEYLWGDSFPRLSKRYKDWNTTRETKATEKKSLTQHSCKKCLFHQQNHWLLPSKPSPKVEVGEWVATENEFQVLSFAEFCCRVIFSPSNHRSENWTGSLGWYFTVPHSRRNVSLSVSSHLQSLDFTFSQQFMRSTVTRNY